MTTLARISTGSSELLMQPCPCRSNDLETHLACLCIWQLSCKLHFDEICVVLVQRSESPASSPCIAGGKGLHTGTGSLGAQLRSACSAHSPPFRLKRVHVTSRARAGDSAGRDSGCAKWLEMLDCCARQGLVTGPHCLLLSISCLRCCLCRAVPSLLLQLERTGRRVGAVP